MEISSLLDLLRSPFGQVLNHITTNHAVMGDFITAKAD